MVPAPAYFLIRIERKDQHQRRKKLGTFDIPDQLTFMQRNMQSGEIVAIGEGAGKYFPEAKIGDILLVHHFVEGMNEDDARIDHLVDQSDDYNYYVVTAYDYEGKRNETYGVYNGEIITNRDYLFLSKPDAPASNFLSPEDYITHALQPSESGLLVFKDWKETREDREDKMARLNMEVGWLSRSDPNKPHIRAEIMKKEEELQSLSNKINHQIYAPFKLVAFNPELRNHFAVQIEPGMTIYCLEAACLTTIEFMNIEYIVTQQNYIGLVVNQAP